MMTNDQQLQSGYTSIQILLVDDDLIFGVGLRTVLQEQDFTDLNIFNQVTTAESALEILAVQLPDLIILELSIRLSSPAQLSGLQLCQELQSQYPNLPIFLLTAQTNPELLIAAYNLGVKGYSAKGTPIDSLVRGLRQVALGNDYWQIQDNIQEIAPKKRQKKWLEIQRSSGIKQIEANLRQVNNNLINSNLPVLDWLFWTGRKRELLFARWLVNQLLPVEYVIVENSQRLIPPAQNNIPSPIVDASQLTLIPRSERILANPNIFERTLTQIQSGVDNFTNSPLEIDVLRQNTKKDLLYSALTQINRTLEELKFTNTNQEDLSLIINGIIKDLWQYCCFEFITKYYGYVFNQKVQLLDILIREANFIGKDLLEQIPFRLEIFEYLIAEDSVNEPEKVKERWELLLQNLVIEIANGVMLTILNNFVDEEVTQPDIYNENIISSRDIAQFRNSLSWKYRLNKYIEEPKNIFEDQYKIYYFSNGGIKTTYIKASRKAQLKQLKGFPWLVTIVIEARDALAPGIRSLIDWIGKSFVYLLTEVIGRAIGLIGKGFIQGIGNTLQETRYRQKKPKNK